MRIQKYLSEQGILSRREAEQYMLAGKVLLNGAVVKDLGRQMDPEKDRVKVLPITDSKKETIAKKKTVVIYKPRGIVSSRIKTEGKTIYELFPQYSQLHIAGRLDKESEGLLLLTNDGVLAKKLTGEDHQIEKEYRVTIQELVSENPLRKMATGIRLKDGMTLPAKTFQIDDHEYGIVLREGRNHQIRRMADGVRLTVTRLVRVRIGTIHLGNLAVGKDRELSEQEVAALKKL
jgi:pseudouridine synthase